MSRAKSSTVRRTPEHTAWRHLRERCLNPTHLNYHNYGGRGITVCDEWRNDFSKFLEDMGPRPSSSHTLERVDNNKGYSKDNCVWATRKEQTANTRKTRPHELNGERLTQNEWARRNGIPQCTISLRLKRGWNPERALAEPPVDYRGQLIEHDGEKLTIAEWSRKTGIAPKLIGQPLRNGWPPSRALTTASHQSKAKAH